jgi:hypothetical protein
MNPNQKQYLEDWLRSVGLWYYLACNKKSHDALIIYKWDEREQRKHDLCEIELREFKK